MNDSEIKIKNFVKNYLKQRGVAASDDDVRLSVYSGEVFDSLFQIELVLFLEKNFNVQFGSDVSSSEAITSLNAALDAIKKLR